MDILWNQFYFWGPIFMDCQNLPKFAGSLGMNFAINRFIINPSLLSLLILLTSQSVILCSGSPHWFAESISPLSETDEVVHNVFLNTQCINIVL